MASSCNQVEDKEIQRKEVKSMGQKEVEQMMRTRGMSKAERKQSKEMKQKKEKTSDRGPPTSL